MKYSWLIAIGYMVISRTLCSDCEIDSLSFPHGLKFGAGSSSYQVEGAWNVSGKGESIWDWWTHNYPWKIVDHTNGDVACDSYHKYKEDVQWLKNLGFDHYRLSISWTRILPTGLANRVNADGIQFYKNLIIELLANGVEPIVTLHHFDHPQILEDMGGWTNELMVDWFVDYARIIFEEIGPYVKTFTTINEPQVLCGAYQGTYPLSPDKHLLDIGTYLCIHNVLKAHARTYHMYDEEFRPSQHGKIGLAIPCLGWNSDNTAVTDTAFQFDCGILAHPIYIGDYPPIVKARVALVSKRQGYSKSRLPEFSPEWISYIKGTADYFGLNHYATATAVPDPDKMYGKHDSDSGIIILPAGDWLTNQTAEISSRGFGDLLRRIKKEYHNPPVYILENGFTDTGSLKDYDRIKYFYTYLKELFKAIKQDGCHVLKYTLWSLMDNFQFSLGYSSRFGIISVDFNSTNKDRTAKLSGSWWREVMQARKLLDVPDE